MARRMRHDEAVDHFCGYVEPSRFAPCEMENPDYWQGVICPCGCPIETTTEYGLCNGCWLADK